MLCAKLYLKGEERTYFLCTKSSDIVRCTLLSFPLCYLQVLNECGKQHFLLAIQVQKDRKAENHKITVFSLSTETAWSLVNLSSHRNITSILSRYLSPADSIFSPNANDFCGMRLALNWIHLVKYFSLLFEREKMNLVNCWKCLCSKITSVLINCSVF